MENHKTTYITIGCVILLFFTFYLLNKNRETSQLQTSLSNLISDLQVKEDFFQQNMKTVSEMNGLYAPDILCQENNHEKKLSELAQEKPIFICMYKIECSACEKDELKELRDAFMDTSPTAYILCSHMIRRDLYVYAKKNQVEIPVLAISSDSLNWVAENYNKPYYFVLHPNMKISHVYIPSKNYPELNKQYFEGVKRFLSDQPQEVK